MKATELRIGNIAMHQGKTIVITNVLDWCVNMELEPMSGDIKDEIEIDEIEPVKLTEELLLKNGFEREDSPYPIGNPSHSFIHNETDLVLQPVENGFQLFVENETEGCSIDVTVEFIHELQNLFFVLFKKEMNFIV